MHATMNVNTYSIDEAVAKQLKVNKNWNHRKIIMKCKKNRQIEMEYASYDNDL